MQAINERELVERCRRGDEGAFQELVDRYKTLVFALIARTVQDRSRAEDLSQEVFLRIHRGLPYFRGEARLSTWIYRIVANVCSLLHDADAYAAMANAVNPYGDGRAAERSCQAMARLLGLDATVREFMPGGPGSSPDVGEAA